MDSRRHIKGAIFRYNESCEERTQELSEFCNWFEMYENIWPLPLVSSEVQYSQFANPREDDEEEDEMDDDGFRTVQAMWPQIQKGADDLAKIMNVTAEMGQKALKADLKEQLLKLGSEVAQKNMRIEDLEKKLRIEVDKIKAKEAEQIRERQMHEVKMKRKEEEIEKLKEDTEKLIERHRKEMTDIKALHAAEVARLQAKMEEMKKKFQEEIERLQEQIERHKGAMKALEHIVEEWKGKYTELEGEKQKVEKELFRQGQELAIVRVQMNQVTSELAAERDNPYVKKLELSVDEMKSKIKLLEGKIEELEKELKAKIAEIKALEAKLKKAEEEIAELKAEIVRMKEKEAELQAKLLETLNRLEAANKRIAELLAEVEKLKEVIKQKDEVIASKDRQMENMNKEFEKERQRHENDKDVLRAEIKQWQKQLDETVEELAREAAKVRELQKKLKESELLVEQANRRKKEIEQRIAAMELEREEERAAAKEREDAIATERDEIQAQLERERADLQSKIKEERETFEATLSDLNARCDELQGFKDEIEGRVFEHVHTQCDEGWFASQLPPGQGGGGGGGMFGGEGMRKRFEALKERMLDVKLDFETQMTKFKDELFNAVDARSHWQKELDGKSAKMLDIYQAVEKDMLAKRGELKKDGLGDMAEEVLSMCRAAKSLVDASGSMKSSAFEGDASHAVSVVDRIPVTMYEIERVLEGIDAFFDPMATPPTSAPSSRPSSAKVKHLRPLLARASAGGEASLAETANDFSKLNHLKPMGDANGGKAGAGSQPPYDAGARGRPSQLQPEAVSSRPVAPGVIPSWSDRARGGPSLGLAYPEEDAAASWSYAASSPMGPRGARGGASVLAPFASPVNPALSAQNTSGTDDIMSPNFRSETAMSGEETMAAGRAGAYTPTPTSMARNKPLSARGDMEGRRVPVQWERDQASNRDTSQHRSPTQRRIGSVTDRGGAPSSWRKLADNAPPEVPKKVGTMWAASGSGGLSGFPEVGTPKVMREAGPDDGVRWFSPNPTPSTIQKWAPGSMTQRHNVGALGPTDLAEEMLEEMRRRDRPNYMPPRPNTTDPGDRGRRSVSPDVLKGSREGLRPGKVLKGRTSEYSPSRNRDPHEMDAAYELMHGGR